MSEQISVDYGPISISKGVDLLTSGTKDTGRYVKDGRAMKVIEGEIRKFKLLFTLSDHLSDVTKLDHRTMDVRQATSSKWTKHASRVHRIPNRRTRVLGHYKNTHPFNSTC